MKEERKPSVEPEKVDTGLVGPSQRMVCLGQELFCRACGTKVEDGLACGRKGCTAFWYCPTCDEFLEWSGSGLAEEMTEEGLASMKSFLRYARGLAQKEGATSTGSIR